MSARLGMIAIADSDAPPLCGGRYHPHFWRRATRQHKNLEGLLLLPMITPPSSHVRHMRARGDAATRVRRVCVVARGQIVGVEASALRPRIAAARVGVELTEVTRL